MKITLDIPDGIIAGFFNGVEVTAHGMQLVSYQLSTDDLKDFRTQKYRSLSLGQGEAADRVRPSAVL